MFKVASSKSFSNLDSQKSPAFMKSFAWNYYFAEEVYLFPPFSSSSVSQPKAIFSNQVFANLENNPEVYLLHRFAEDGGG